MAILTEHLAVQTEAPLMQQFSGHLGNSTGTFEPFTILALEKHTTGLASGSMPGATVGAIGMEDGKMVADRLARVTCCAVLEASHNRTMHGSGAD